MDRAPGADGPLARPPGALPAPLSLRAHAPETLPQAAGQGSW